MQYALLTLVCLWSLLQSEFSLLQYILFFCNPNSLSLAMHVVFSAIQIFSFAMHVVFSAIQIFSSTLHAVFSAIQIFSFTMHVVFSAIQIFPFAMHVVFSAIQSFLFFNACCLLCNPNCLF